MCKLKAVNGGKNLLLPNDEIVIIELEIDRHGEGMRKKCRRQKNVRVECCS